MTEGLSFSLMLTGSADKALAGVAADGSKADIEESGSDNPFSLLFNGLNTEKPQGIQRKNSAALAESALQLTGTAGWAEFSVDEAEGDSALASQLLGLISQAGQTETHWQASVTEADEQTVEQSADTGELTEKLLTETELLPESPEQQLTDDESPVTGKEPGIVQRTAPQAVEDETGEADEADKTVTARSADKKESPAKEATATVSAEQHDIPADETGLLLQQTPVSVEDSITANSSAATPAAQNMHAQQNPGTANEKVVAETTTATTAAIAEASVAADNDKTVQTAAKMTHTNAAGVQQEPADNKASGSEKVTATTSERVGSNQTGGNGQNAETNSQPQTASAAVRASEQGVTAPAGRTESFADTLNIAEQRQQVRDTQPVTAAEPNKSLAEQLKQSLNLLQQDAASQLRERVHLMVRQNIQVAEIRLDPAELGQMQIKVNMQQDQASVQFLVQQPQAKELLEQQLPRLRELLQQQGIQLAEGQVQQQQQHQQSAQQKQGQGQHNAGNPGQTENMEHAGEPVTVNVRLSDRLVDYYA